MPNTAGFFLLTNELSIWIMIMFPFRAEFLFLTALNENPFAMNSFSDAAESWLARLDAA